MRGAAARPRLHPWRFGMREDQGLSSALGLERVLDGDPCVDPGSVRAGSHACGCFQRFISCLNPELCNDPVGKPAGNRAS